MSIDIPRILITGARGQLGTCLALMLSRSGIPHLATDVDTLDAADADAVARTVRREEVTHIVNCAAYTAVDRAEQEPDLARHLNADLPAALSAAAHATGARLLHISTDYVFPGNASTPYTETSPTSPLGVYGATKLEGEQRLHPDDIVVRTAWLYSHCGNNFVKTMLRLAADGRDELRVVSDQVGTPTSALDLARALVTIVTAPQWHPGIYHYTNEGVCSWYDLAKATVDLAGLPCRVTPIRTDQYPTAARRPAYSVLDKTRYKTVYSAAIPHWHDALKEVIQHLI